MYICLDLNETWHFVLLKVIVLTKVNVDMQNFYLTCNLGSKVR